MQQKTFSVSDPDLGEIEITITRATVQQTIRLNRLTYEGFQTKDDDPDVHLVRCNEWPRLNAATLRVVGLDWPPTFEDFLSWPGEMVARWQDEILALNPQFMPPQVTPEEKKESPTISTTNSAHSTPKAKLKKAFLT
jgi:hypothetical protein